MLQSTGWQRAGHNLVTEQQVCILPDAAQLSRGGTELKTTGLQASSRPVITANPDLASGLGSWTLGAGDSLPQDRAFNPAGLPHLPSPTSYRTQPSIITFVPIPLKTWISWASGQVTLVTPECTSDFHRKGLSFKSQGHMSLCKPGRRAAGPQGTGKVQSGGCGAGGRGDRTRIQTGRHHPRAPVLR